MFQQDISDVPGGQLVTLDLEGYRLPAAKSTAEHVGERSTSDWFAGIIPVTIQIHG